MKRILFAILFALIPTLAFGQPDWGVHADGGTLYFYTNTVGTDGVAETPASEAIAVYKDGSATQFTTGATIDDDFDSIVGYHQVAIDTTQADLTTGSRYTVVYSAGTVDSVSIAGRVIGTFRLGEVPADVVKVSGDSTVPDKVEQEYDQFTFVVHDGTDTTSGTTAESTIEAASAGTTVFVGPGVYNFQTARLAVPNGVRVIGAGSAVTHFTTAHAVSSEPFIRPGTRNHLQGFTIKLLHAAAQGIGTTGSETFTSARCVDVPIIAGDGSSAIAFNSNAVAELEYHDAILDCNDDAILTGASAANKLTLRNAIMRGCQDIGLSIAGTSSAYAYNSIFAHRSDATAELIGVAPGATLELHQSSIWNATGFSAIDNDGTMRLSDVEADRTQIVNDGTLRDVFSPIRSTAVESATGRSRSLDIATTGEAGTDLNNVLGGLGAAEIDADAIGASELATDAIGALEVAAAAVGNSEFDVSETLTASATTPDTMQSTTIATVTTQQSMTLTAGSADNDAYNGCLAIITDQSTATQKAKVRIADYVGSTRTVTFVKAPAFTIAVGDTIVIEADEPQGGPFETASVPSSRVLTVKDRGDGTFGIAGGKKIRMSAGEGPQWWAIEFAGTVLAPGDELDSMEAPSVTGAQAANLTMADYGPKGTRALVKPSLAGGASSSDTINVVITINPDGDEEFVVTVPVQVGG